MDGVGRKIHAKRWGELVKWLLIPEVLSCFGRTLSQSLGWTILSYGNGRPVFDLADQTGLKALPTLLVGHMSDRKWDPSQQAVWSKLFAMSSIFVVKQVLDDECQEVEHIGGVVQCHETPLLKIPRLPA